MMPEVLINVSICCPIAGEPGVGTTIGRSTPGPVMTARSGPFATAPVAQNQTNAQATATYTLALVRPRATDP